MARFMIKATTTQEFWMEVEGQDEAEVRRAFFDNRLHPLMRRTADPIHVIEELKELS